MTNGSKDNRQQQTRRVVWAAEALAELAHGTGPDELRQPDVQPSQVFEEYEMRAETCLRLKAELEAAGVADKVETAT